MSDSTTDDSVTSEVVTSDAVRRLPVDNPRVYAFEISGKVSSEAMESMAKTMNAAFDTHEGKVRHGAGVS